MEFPQGFKLGVWAMSAFAGVALWALAIIMSVLTFGILAGVVSFLVGIPLMFMGLAPILAWSTK